MWKYINNIEVIIESDSRVKYTNLANDFRLLRFVTENLPNLGKFTEFQVYSVTLVYIRTNKLSLKKYKN